MVSAHRVRDSYETGAWSEVANRRSNSECTFAGGGAVNAETHVKTAKSIRNAARILELERV
jgi:hypothetical protein